MTELLQSICLIAYRIIAATGFFDTRIGEKMFFAAYDSYKEWLEAPAADALVKWVSTGTVVIDVGANVGFFTLRFASWVGQDGRVIAIEPEPKNIRQLRRRIESGQFSGRVDVIEGVAAERSRTLNLVLNPHHPGDHKIGTFGIAVPTWTIDEIMRKWQSPEVSLIKIDVQGAEVRVLRGARETILKWRPTLFVEVDDAALIQAGFSADQLFDEIEGLGYKIFNPSDPTVPLTKAKFGESRRALPYADYLCRG
jgi:FkbM family methyltransferase